MISRKWGIRVVAGLVATALWWVAGPIDARAQDDLAPGKTFRDCSDCPEMMAVPAGRFQMGSPASEAGRYDDEGPQREVKISAPFAIGVYEVTVAQFRAFVKASGYKTGNACWTDLDQNSVWEDTPGYSWKKPGLPGYQQTDNDPVVCLNWKDALAYARWLATVTGKQYRLPTAAEWEYAARADTSTPYPWGADPDQGCSYANGSDAELLTQYDLPRPNRAMSCNDRSIFTSAVGQRQPNGFGLYDMIGNAWEWLEDCYRDSFEGAPTDGSAVTGENCSRRVLRGGGWYSNIRFLRPANRGSFEAGVRANSNGVRVAMTL